MSQFRFNHAFVMMMVGGTACAFLIPPRITERAKGKADVLLYPVPLNPEEILLQRLAIDEVRAAIRRLPPLWREAVELRDIEGLSYQEIAEVLGSPVGTVMSRLYRGRNLIRSLLLERPIAQSRENRGV